MQTKVHEANNRVIKQCRLQIGYDISLVEKRVGQIKEIEAGTYTPTIAQLDKLSKLYAVPRWVFISQELPTEFDFSRSLTAFRLFTAKNPDTFADAKIRAITSRVSQLRELLLELQADFDEPTLPFAGPVWSQETPMEELGQSIRAWLGVGDEHYSFREWKNLLESKGLFVFSTAKYRGWSYIDNDSFRGLSIFHELRPIIVVNGKDWKAAHSFTLFHELGHILRSESSLDAWESNAKGIELWCDNLAGSVLMPARLITSSSTNWTDLSAIKNEAKRFKVSTYALLVRLRKLDVIPPELYSSFVDRIRDEYKENKSKLEASDRGPNRNRPAEVLNEYGRLLTSTLVQAYNYKILDMQNLIRTLGVKNFETVRKIDSLL